MATLVPFDPARPVVDAGPVVVGAGLAGLAAAISLAPRPCTLLCATPLGGACATAWAQGGIAAAVGTDDDPVLHLADTLDAADGLADEAAARAILSRGPETVAWLETLGARFDRDPATGALRLGLEAAHGRRRIVHADGDGTGREVLRALVAHVRTRPSVTVREGFVARRLLLDAEGRVAGLLAVRLADGAALAFRTDAVVLATGGLGALWAHTTNPAEARGHGVALAALAGASLIDLEFTQFHPTAIDVGLDPMPLASEAIRGEGAHLVDDTGARFLREGAETDSRAELAPRDIVARAVASRLAAGHRVFLDARASVGDRFARRFPAVDAFCRAAGIDPARTPIPVRPALHYAMGGVQVDGAGRSTVAGLFAVGETAATGLHGANRLASNSLLEAAVTGRAAGTLLRDAARFRAASAVAPPAPEPDGRDLAPIRRAVEHGFGVLRDEQGMRAAARALQALRGDPAIDALALTTARLVAASALARDESRGAHARADRPGRHAAALRRPTTLAAAEALLDARASPSSSSRREVPA